MCNYCDSYAIPSRNHPRASERSSAKWKSLVTKEQINGELGRLLVTDCHDDSSPQLHEKKNDHGNESIGKEEACEGGEQKRLIAGLQLARVYADNKFRNNKV